MELIHSAEEFDVFRRTVLTLWRICHTLARVSEFRRSGDTSFDRRCGAWAHH